MNSLTTTYHSIEDLPVWNFYNALQKWDFSYIGPDADEKLWYKIYDEYFIASKMRMPDFKLFNKVSVLEIKAAFIEALIMILNKKSGSFDSAKDALAELGYKYDDKKTLGENVERFESTLAVLYDKIKILRSGLPEHKENSVDLWAEVVVLKKHFRFDIDPKKMTCIEWIKLKEEFKRDVKSS